MVDVFSSQVTSSQVRGTFAISTRYRPPTGVKARGQWLRNGKAIKGATKAVYKLAKGDKGKKIAVKVAGKKAGYTSKSVVSKATKKVG